jgi:glutamate-1-semialdehyde 2,1-aminomutase
MSTYHQRVRQILPGGVHYNFKLPWDETPLHFAKTKDSYVWDMEGKQYLDLSARFGALILGHGNSEYSESLKDTIDRVLAVNHCDMDAEALELISHHIPSAEMVRFGVSGTEIVQNAIRLARAWTGKNRFIRFEGHYHGNADNIMGGKARRQDVEPIPVDFVGDFKGTAGRAQGALETQSYLLPWNNIEILETFLEKKANEIAAIITEPVGVNAGSIMPAPGYLQKVRELCDKYGIVLIFDEIITGVRMGLGGAQKNFNVIPDLTTLGKAIAGGGVPVAALVGKKEIMKLLADKKVVHAGTFNGYSLGTAAVKTTFEILSRNAESALTQMNEKTSAIHKIFVERAEKMGMPLTIQGPTACASYHCTNKILENVVEYTSSLMSMDIILNNILAKNGILVSTFSRIYPNISLDWADVEWFAERIDNALLEAKNIYEQINA